MTRGRKKSASKTKKESASPQPAKKIVVQTEEIKTDVDRVVELVGASAKNKMPLRKIAKQLNIPYDVVEKWARILDENNVLELVYPKNPFISAYLKVKKPEYVEKVDENGLVKKKVEGHGKKERKSKEKEELERRSAGTRGKGRKESKPGGRETPGNVRKRSARKQRKGAAKTSGNKKTR